MPMDAVPIQDASIRAPWTRIKMLLAVVKSPTSDNNFAPPVASRAVSWYPIPLPSIFFFKRYFLSSCTRISYISLLNVKLKRYILFKLLPEATRRLYGVLTRSYSRPWTTVIFSLQNLHEIMSSLIELASNPTAPSCCKWNRK